MDPLPWGRKRPPPPATILTACQSKHVCIMSTVQFFTEKVFSGMNFTKSLCNSMLSFLNKVVLFSFLLFLPSQKILTRVNSLAESVWGGVSVYSFIRASDTGGFLWSHFSHIKFCKCQSLSHV